MITKMLRWISVVTRHDHIWDEDIRDRYGIRPNVEKLVIDGMVNEISFIKIGRSRWEATKKPAEIAVMVI